MHDDFDPTPTGLLRCLQVLAAEAAYLSLRNTFAALQDTIAICQEESSLTLAAQGEIRLTSQLH